MKIIALIGSPRKNSNCEIIVDEIAKGAEENGHEVIKYIVNDLDIPTLKLAYPTSQKQLISLIEKTNNFLKNLDETYSDDLGADLTLKKDKCPFTDVKRILDKLI